MSLNLNKEDKLIAKCYQLILKGLSNKDAKLFLKENGLKGSFEFVDLWFKNHEIRILNE